RAQANWTWQVPIRGATVRSDDIGEIANRGARSCDPLGGVHIIVSRANFPNKLSQGPGLWIFINAKVARKSRQEWVGLTNPRPDFSNDFAGIDSTSCLRKTRGEMPK